MKKYSKPTCEYIEFELMDDILAASGEGDTRSRDPHDYGVGNENACRKANKGYPF